ncbi:MAG: anaerobic glycerol-3-phosphate dehydrogenase subunit A [Chloroflexi bacterium]|nr:anaerobic glycerol-3-phosphate dehydrogenase subunit A [Chloroflexota bacterium]
MEYRSISVDLVVRHRDATLPRTADVLIVGGGATGAGLLRDLSRRGLSCVLVDKGDFGSGTSGRYHGLLHSGARYVAKDPLAARECIVENRVVRRIAPACIEDTGGLFVATPDDPEDYVAAFPARCAAAGIPCEEVPLGEMFRREPALSRRIRRAFRVLDASLEPWQLIEANLAEAEDRGAIALGYRQVVGMDRNGGFIASVAIADRRTGTVDRIAPRIVVSAAGAWAGRIAALAGARLDMSPGKGTMLIYNQRMTDTVVNRCHPPGDGDIMVPVHTVAILGTTEVQVDDPDAYAMDRDEVEALIVEGEKLFPEIRRMRLLRAYAGIRPLYSADDGAGDGRAISRAHVLLDHERRDGIANFLSIVGGKLTTYRLMAEQTADLACEKLGVDVRCTTAEDPLPGKAPGRPYHWLGDRLAEHEAAGGGDASLICECELVTRPMLDRFLADRWPCSLDDVRRGTRLGMGPCQGAFCTFRAAGVVADEVARRAIATAGADPRDAAAEIAERALVAFIRERYAGTRPIAWGRQLQELWLATGIYWGSLGIDAFEASPRPVDGPSAGPPDLTGETTHAAR